MAIFDKLFSSNDSQKIRLIRELTRFRIKTDPAAPVMGIDKDQVDSLSDSQLLMLPEASIATIVETYIQFVRRGTTAQSALSQIDVHRSSGFGSVRSAETANLFDYVADRMRIEHPQAGALDQAFVDSAVYTSAKVFGMEVELPTRQPYQVIRIADIYFQNSHCQIQASRGGIPLPLEIDGIRTIFGSIFFLLQLGNYPYHLWIRITYS
jgi:hypothetical protein